MATGNAKRFIELGVAPTLAIEMSRQITAGAGNVRRLMELGMQGRSARIFVAGIGGTAIIPRILSETGVANAVVREIVAQVGGGTPTPTPTAPIPTNYEAIYFGDSRTEDGVGSTASQTTGYNPKTQNIGYVGWISPLSGNKLRAARYSNFGIAASTLPQGAAEPRLDATGVASTGRWDRPNGSANYASNKDALSAAAHSAGIVMLLYGTNWPSGAPADQLGYIDTILNNIGTSKVVVLLNEQPRGIDFTGASQNAASNAVDRYTFSRELLKYDYASGDARSRANVIAVNVFDEFLDTASGTAYLNKRGYLRDGLHDTPYGSRRKAQKIVDKLSAVWANWASLPAQVTLPTTNGLTTAAASQPFIHTNPILTPGTDGQVLGTWGAAPLASGVPQGWQLSATTNGSGITAVATKGAETDPDGFPVCKIVFSGTLAANSTANLDLQQVLGSTALATALSAGNVSINDKFRMTANIEIDAGSAYLAGVFAQLTVQDSTSTRTQLVQANQGVIGSGTDNGTAINAYLDAGDGTYQRLLTEMLDCQDPNLVAQSQNIAAFANITGAVRTMFRNNTGAAVNVSATIRVSRAGVWRATA